MKRGVRILFWILLIIVWCSNTALSELAVIGTAAYNGRDYNLIYEDDRELVWLDYSNPGKRSGGPWARQVAWAAGLNLPGVLTYKFKPGIRVSWEGAWRLPLTKDGARKWGYDGTTTAGFNITTSEMGHLYYKSLGNLGYYDTKGNPRPGWGKPESEHGWGLKNTGPFDNLTDALYYSGTVYGPNPKEFAWIFSMYYGSQFQNRFIGTTVIPAMAVRPATVSEQ